jgi:hypothetical protein
MAETWLKWLLVAMAVHKTIAASRSTVFLASSIFTKCGFSVSWWARFVPPVNLEALDGQ